MYFVRILRCLVRESQPHHHILKVKSGYLWIIIVHMNYTSEVNEVAVKTGTLPSGNTVNCKLMDVEALVGEGSS